MTALSVISPTVNAVVHAAAGTGKTWLLTSRIIRLLLAGALPGSILAITFTRKAAADIHERLRQRLLAMASANDEQLDKLLSEIDADATPATRLKARSLYEHLLTVIHDLRATTFHAFCQDLLRRFPLETELPPAFELSEHTHEIEVAAWQALDRELTQNSSSDSAQAMDTLLRAVDGTDNTRRALRDFLAHRSDWWAYTEKASNPIGFAVAELQKRLDITLTDDPQHTLLADKSLRTQTARFAELIIRHPIASHQEFATAISEAYAPDASTLIAYNRLRKAFFTQTGLPRALKIAKKFESLLGASGATELTQLHKNIINRLETAHERYLKFVTLQASRAWYVCGQRLLDHFQRLKREHGLLDFADLEWHAYRLLNRDNHAEWVQYKLDQRIDHLLIDEFQDTNPTQWRLLLPLLQEMAAGNPDRARSIFIVGDEKQSIYRFRRADPKLFHVAHDWLIRHARAHTATQHISWRSSPAIIQFVNLVFDPTNTTSNELNDENTDNDSWNNFSLTDFNTHSTHHEQLWGFTEVLPLIHHSSDNPEVFTGPLRNSLKLPRLVAEDERHRREGELIAVKIKELLGRKLCVGDKRRSLSYGDIMILLRHRTHAAAYELALRHAEIPYIGIGRGNFLDCLEAQDLIHLLTVLIAPYNNLALASVLRSPLFSVSNEHLVTLASTAPHCSWFERLSLVYKEMQSDTQAIARADRLLHRWMELVDRIPIHDLLDRIYNEGNVVARYLSASPPHLRTRVRTNLDRMLALALEIDSGRYPSLTHFLHRIDALTRDEDEALPISDNAQNYVRLLTIHGAKGLEAPVIFLANAAATGNRRDKGPRALIEWPADRDRPQIFHLVGKKETLDAFSQEAIKRQDIERQREEANLFYVALTRAKQALYISGCEPGGPSASTTRLRQRRNWYGFIEQRLDEADRSGTANDIGFRVQRAVSVNGTDVFNIFGRVEHGRPSSFVQLPDTVRDTVVDPALTHAFAPTAKETVIRPSQEISSQARLKISSTHLIDETTPEGPHNTNIRRGIAIHRMLELLTVSTISANACSEIKRRIAREINVPENDKWFLSCWHEACAVVEDPKFRDLYEPSRFLQARNETPILYRRNDQIIYGIVDRLLLRPDETVLIDYKTHGVSEGESELIVEQVAPQMRLYAEGARQLWPQNKIRSLLLFTASRRLIEITSMTEKLNAT